LSEGNHRGRKEHTVTAQTSTVTFYPSVLYRDADAAMNWLERALGFERREDQRDAEGHVAHAEMSLGPAIVMLGSAGAGREPFRSLPAGGSEPMDTDYGSRDFTVRDPEGNLWAFGTYRPIVE
jgi:uncharacterized glyoxalase superfamily protein PhnB